MKLANLVLWPVVLIGPLLAGCAPPPPPEPPRFLGPPVPAPGALPFPGSDVTPGFNDKEPDTCKAAGLQGLIGQPAGMMRTVAVAGPVRVIRPGDLLSQEYNAQRIDVDVDANGNIWRIRCG